MGLDSRTIDQAIRQLFADIFSTQNEGVDAPPLDDDTVLLATGLDSLGFAILVTRLEMELGYDPFSLAADAYYPKTYKELLAFYLANQPK